MSNLVLFPTGYRGLSRHISPQAYDKVYIKGFNKQGYVLSYSVLRTEQKFWARSKYGTPEIDDAWDLTLQAKSIINSQVEKIKKKKRRPTWYEIWLTEELSVLRSLALQWIIENHKLTEFRRLFLISDFMAQGITDLEESSWFMCPDSAFPAIEVRYKGQTQTTGVLALDDRWESATESNYCRNQKVDTKYTPEEVMQWLWRFIPDETYEFSMISKIPPSALANGSNLADIDEVIRKEEQLQYAIEGRAIRRKNQASTSQQTSQ